MQGVAVIIFRHQPPTKLPPLAAESSRTKSFHTPLGLVPLKTDKAEPPDGAGAGAGNVSPIAKLEGLNVPDTSGPASGIVVAAVSSKVTVAFIASAPPPASDNMIALAPVGLTSNRSMSSGKVWLRLFSVTATWLTVPVIPETFITEG